MNQVRSLVSKKKKRFTEDGFDLDLTYITPRIIAMGFPSTGKEAYYRNPMPEVQRFFNKRHAGHFKVYNLCSERSYDLGRHFPLTERFPFDDHNPCPLAMINNFCVNVDFYLAQHPQNVVGIHCKAGKGRTGLMICCYLVHSGVCKNAVEALDLFARQRTYNAKGVTIPSQIRYVYYYDHLLSNPTVQTDTYRINHIRFVTVPNFNKTGNGSLPYIIVKLVRNKGGFEEAGEEIVAYNMKGDDPFSVTNKNNSNTVPVTSPNSSRSPKNIANPNTDDENDNYNNDYNSAFEDDNNSLEEKILSSTEDDEDSRLAYESEDTAGDNVNNLYSDDEEEDGLFCDRKPQNRDNGTFYDSDFSYEESNMNNNEEEDDNFNFNTNDSDEDKSDDDNNINVKNNNQKSSNSNNDLSGRSMSNQRISLYHEYRNSLISPSSINSSSSNLMKSEGGVTGAGTKNNLINQTSRLNLSSDRVMNDTLGVDSDDEGNSFNYPSSSGNLLSPSLSAFSTNQMDETFILDKSQEQTEESIDFIIQDRNIRIRDDVKILVKNYDDQHMCHFWFNTAFIGENNMIVLEKSIVDKANKDKKKKFDANFKVEIYFDLMDEDDEDYEEYLYTLHASSSNSNNTINDGTEDRNNDDDEEEEAGDD